ncbi:MAG: hypothetical protein GEV08_18400 [Acidimicrobiia bacterium]|nr:hypothetical protein [Acidimicrobiia bacterium]
MTPRAGDRCAHLGRGWSVEALALPLAALVAGFISFSSPCCLPLLPGYLSYVSALPVAELGRRDARAVTLRASLLFVAGFTTVFVALGIGATAFGSLLLRNQDTLVRWFGVFIIVMGLATMGVLRIPVPGRAGPVSAPSTTLTPWDGRSPKAASTSAATPGSTAPTTMPAPSSASTPACPAPTCTPSAPAPPSSTATS